MIRRLCWWGMALALVAGLPAAEPVNQLALALTATPAHPRNSEGAFATLASGRVIFVYSQFSGGTSDFSPCQLAEIHSDDQGRTWSEPRVLFTPERGTMEMSVSLLRLASGKLALFSAIKHGTLDCRPYLRISTDEGATWSAPRSLITAPGYFVLNNDRVIQTSRGRLIMPLAYHRTLHAADTSEEGNDLRAISLWYYSDDEGQTWAESPTWWTIPVASKTGLQEPGVVELADGSLFSWARTDQGTQYGFRSLDAGLTWSAPHMTTLRSPASPASIKRLPKSPDLLAVYNDHTGQFPFVFSGNTYSGRTPLVAALSSDGGATWRTAKLLESEPDRDYCYTAIHYVGDAVLFAYMSNSRDRSRPSEMTIRRMNLAWLTAPDSALVTRCRESLHQIMDAEQSWVKIHAAEALIAGGEAVAIRDQFLQMAPHAADKVYRVGIWRVLTNTAPTVADRQAAISEVENIFLNPQSPDRSQAIETLCKVRAELPASTLDVIRPIAADPTARLRPLALWSLRLNHQPGAVEQMCELLKSKDEVMRVGAAYGLRFMRETDPAALRAIAAAAEAEGAGTRAGVYFTSAAYALGADPALSAKWKAALEAVLVSGNDELRFEACNGLVARAHAADLPKYLPLLDAAGNDSRVGAALTILYVHARE